jgi:hypothetical protein
MDDDYSKKWTDAISKNADLLSEISSPLALANQVAQSIANANTAGFNVLIPTLTQEWAEEVIQDFLFTVAEIAEDAGQNSKLVDRDLYDPENLASVEWYEGIQLEDVLPFPDANNDIEFWDEIRSGELDHYGDFGIGPGFARRFLQKTDEKPKLSPQYNRLFPLKIVMRVAANLLLNRTGLTNGTDDDSETVWNPIFLDDLRTECAKVAKYAKKRMQWIDNNKGTDFGSWFSVALTDGSKKQDERFMVQFVGSVRNKGQGLPFEIGFLDVDPDGEVKITELGLQFTLEENPIIDQQDGWKDGISFTESERKILLHGINSNLEGEMELIEAVLDAVKSGKKTPTDIEKILIEMSYSETEASVVRTGLMARMTELGLVNRIKKGRNVFYEAR